jgi:hypothetical protein
MNIGRPIEDLVDSICARSFFADFTIKSPKYYKFNGQEKEAADVLVVFNDTLLAIQIKSKEFDSSPQQPSPAELMRVSKTIGKAIRQFHALGEAMGRPNFKSFANGRGIEVEFDRNQITDIILIVIFAPVWKEGSDTPARIRFDATCYAEGKIPIHLFTLEQFALLLKLLDTLPDFLLYLMARSTLHDERLIPQDSDPIDEWALVTFERKRLAAILQKRTFTDLSGLFRRHEISLSRLERRERPSYFIDRLIEQLNATIGSTLTLDPRYNLLADPNSLKAYHSLIPHLAKLNRDERGRLTEFLLKIVMRCHKQGFAFRGFKFNEQSDEAYVVLAANRERDERRIALVNIALAMGFKLKAKTVIGLAVGHDWPESPIFDMALTDVSKAHPDADFLRSAERCFAKTRVTDNNR